MMFGEDEAGQHVPALDSDTSAYIADTCLAATPTERNSQLCVLSTGLDLEGVAARMIEAQRRHFTNRLFLVVLPDGIQAGTTTDVAATLAAQFAALALPAQQGTLSHSAPTTHAMEEGTSVKDRCTAYQRGGVVVIASRMLCADILHKRLALAVVGLAIVLIPYHITQHGSTARRSDVITPSLAFSVELFLRGRTGAMGARAVTTQRPPQAGLGETTSTDAITVTTDSAERPHRAVVLLSDNPALVQYLAQRHQIGKDRFIQQMRIGDIQLFPRFRLNLVQHFERLAKVKPLQVDRIVVNVATSILILDDLLQKILREVLSELQAVQRRLDETARVSASADDAAVAPFMSESVSKDGSSLPASFLRRRPPQDSPDDDAVPRAFQPRARLQHETVNGKLDYSSFGKSNHTSSTSARKPTEDYVRRPWRSTGGPASLHKINFSAIPDEVLLDMESTDLDADVTTGHELHDFDWPYRALTESLLDVRWLRCALWSGTCYDFVFALERCLERRQRRSEGQPGAAPPPAALWTLSSHFHDLVTVATHRIGDVALVEDDPYSGVSEVSSRHVSDAARVSQSPSTETVVVAEKSDVDAEEEEEEVEVTIVGSKKPPTYQIVPSREEQDYTVEVAVRLAKSWCRDAVRKFKRQPTSSATPSNGETTTARPSPPVLLFVAHDQRGMVRLMERLLYTADTVRLMELNNFLRRYQYHHGTHPSDAQPPGSPSLIPPPVTVAPCTEPHMGISEAQSSGRQSTRPTTETQMTEALLKQWMHLQEGHVHDTVGASSDSDSDGAESDSGVGERGKSHGLDHAIGTTPGSARAAMQAEIGGALFGNQRPTMPKAASTGHACTPASPQPPPPMSLHQLLLKQVPRLPRSTTQASTQTTVKPGEVSGFSLERIQKGAAVLVAQIASTPSPAVAHAMKEDIRPRLIVTDGSRLTVADYTDFLTGQHQCLRSPLFEQEKEEEERAGTTAANKQADEAEDRLAQAHQQSMARRSSHAVSRVVVLHHSLSVLRQLEMCQDELPADVLRMLKVQLITSTFTDAAVKKSLHRERQAFASLAHVKATLTGTLLMDHAALRETEMMLEDGLLFGNKRRRISRPYVSPDGEHVRGEARLVQPPLIVFDEREFRSSLPYSIYARGMDLVPLTLNTADYILSPDYAVERKSVRDFTQSLTSGRIYHQLAALSRKYPHPLCLIEFSRGAPFRLVYSSMSKTSSERGAMTLMYSRIARVVTSYPRVSWMWSRSPAHSAAMFAELKRNVAAPNVDPSDPSLTSGAANWAEVGGTASPGEASSYAARVLSRFPGITPQNAPKVMQLCGSLASLATVSKASLLGVMGETNGETLYAFLHTPFDEAA